ncbi:Hypothetical protein SMAX5B_009400 [Scophthalmus maximus]|uniref:Uncharacterized protein n=1 Tax=Scophthalmus maximus TaxID=52904 RepID=A0A2U9CA62_SCOMX|nr:Hypothetical protein SMAX5B_009400 [Scophthalmus maximus]
MQTFRPVGNRTAVDQVIRLFSCCSAPLLSLCGCGATGGGRRRRTSPACVPPLEEARSRSSRLGIGALACQ